MFVVTKVKLAFEESDTEDAEEEEEKYGNDENVKNSGNGIENRNDDYFEPFVPIYHSERAKDSEHPECFDEL